MDNKISNGVENNNSKKYFIAVLVISIIASSLFGAAAGFFAGSVSSMSGIRFPKSLENLSLGRQSGTANNPSQSQSGNIVTTPQEQAVEAAVEKVSPTVVSIIISKDLPKIQQFYSPFGQDFFRQFFGDNFNFDLNQPNNAQPSQGGTQKTEIGGGTGFIVSEDGYIVTNKHVVSDTAADYTVLMNDQSKYPAKVLARDPVNDVAILKIDVNKKLPTVEFGDSAGLKVGQSVIAIGNALAEFSNTVSTGVISGLSRSITAGGDITGSEQLANVIQTDASINPGNSGGPLLDLSGRVIGINTAIAQGAQNIGFAIPVNGVKNTIESVRKTGQIVRPWLGIRYVMLTPDIAKQNNFDINYGALVVRGDTRTDLAVIPGSPADKAGIVEDDIILEVNGVKVDEKHPLLQTISEFKVGDQVTLKIMHKGSTKEVKVTLEAMKQ